MICFGEGVTLEPLDSSDLYRLWRNDPTIWRWTRQNDLISVNQHQRWLESQDKDPSIKMYAVTRENDPVGVCGLTSINLTNRNAEFSLYIAHGFQGRGHGKGALLTLFRHGFTNMGLNSIWGETFQGNPAASLFEATGMLKEGVRREAYWKDGAFHDSLFYGILASEFFKRHGVKSCF